MFQTKRAALKRRPFVRAKRRFSAALSILSSGARPAHARRRAERVRWTLLFAEQYPVAVRRAHQKEHRQREPGVGARGQESPAHVLRRRRWRALRHRRDGALLHAPDDAPDVQEHDDAEPAADAYGERFVAEILAPFAARVAEHVD